MLPQSGDSSPIRLTALDGLRGLAAILVAAYHADEFYSRGAPTVVRGYLAVDFFFLLSGFVLAMTYDGRFARGLTAREFMVRRFLRLAPLYWAGCAIGLVSLYSVAGNDWPSRTVTLGLNLLFLPAWSDFSDFIMPVNIPGWSLFFEVIVANGLFAVLWSRLRGRTLVVLVMTAAAVLAYVAKTFGHLNFGFSWHGFVYGFARVLFSFFGGVLLFRWRHRLPSVRVPTLALAALLTASLMVSVDGKAGKVYELACVVMIFPAIVHLGAGSREMSPRTGYLLGELSYGLYAIHYPIITLPPVVALTSHIWPNGSGWRHWYQIPLVLLLALLAWLVVRWIDLPIQRAVARRRANPGAPAGAS